MAHDQELYRAIVEAALGADKGSGSRRQRAADPDTARDALRELGALSAAAERLRAYVTREVAESVPLAQLAGVPIEEVAALVGIPLAGAHRYLGAFPRESE